MHPGLEILLEGVQLSGIRDSLCAGIFLDAPGFFNTVYNGLPGLFQGFHLDGAGRGQLCRQLGLLRRIPGIFEQHLVGAVVQRLHRLCLDLLALEQNRLRQRLFKDGQGDDKSRN